MRRLLALCLLAFPAHAETYAVPSHVEAVTLYPWGASVDRRVEFTAPAGRHSIVVPGLPEGTEADLLRIAAGDGVVIGAFSLAEGRLPDTGDMTPPAIAAAEAEVERLADVVRDREAAIAQIRLRAEAADAQALFLRSIGKGDTAPAGTAGEIQALGQMIGAEILAARQTALAATAEADAAERATRDDREALDAAEQALAALAADPAPSRTLTLGLTKATDGPAVLTIRSFVGDATWRPVYDFHLTRGATPALTVDRGVLVEQYSGEDWLDVTLTLSTARPADRSDPSAIYPWLARIVPEGEAGDYSRSGGVASMPAEAAPAYEPDAVAEKAAAVFEGATVTYRYPAPVDLRTGVEALRLALEPVTLATEIRAVAVPEQDSSAFLVATATNDSGQIFLPGTALLWSDGVLVGQTELPLIAAGDETDVGFGPIDGIILKRTVPDRSEGDTGILSRSTELAVTAILTVENLTGETWQVRLLDRVPYSEQDDLRARYSASPEPSETDVDGDRGVLAWDFDLAPAATGTIELDYSLTWPSGFVLQ